MTSHASVPTAEHVEGDIYRIYFSSRDTGNRSHTGFVEIDITYPSEILNVSKEPLLSPGELGAFDDSGAMLSWIAQKYDTRHFYYIGWNLGVTVPFRNSIGLAISKDKEPICRYANGPIVDRTALEPHFVASCCVIPDGNLWRMWYLSCIGWKVVNNLPQHSYHIKYAESADGITWHRDGTVAIDFKFQGEYAISRPCVLKENGLYRMWYSFRGDSYRIGYAESSDGIHWERLDDIVGINVSDEGWDSEMIEYPFIFDHNGHRYMLYNGNDYGRTGFGLAVLEN